MGAGRFADATQRRDLSSSIMTKHSTHDMLESGVYYRAMASHTAKMVNFMLPSATRHLGRVLATLRSALLGAFGVALAKRVVVSLHRSRQGCSSGGSGGPAFWIERWRFSK